VNDESGSPLAALSGMSPVEVVARLRHLEGLVFFDSSGHLPSGGGAAISIIAAEPVQLLTGSLACEEDAAQLQNALMKGGRVEMDRGFPLGGLCGWIEYDGSYRFGVYPHMLVHCHHSGEWIERGTLSSKMQEPAPVATACPIGEFSAQMSRGQFVEKVRLAQQWIAAGDIYQVNLSQKFQAACADDADLFGLYERLRECSPAPMSAWLRLGGREVLCSSPETFVKISGSMVETRPIKGTRPRFDDPSEDLRSAYELQTSAKEISELVMITDLLRNDLGKVCEFGSVRVDEMLQLEKLEQVFHLVSTVRGQLRSGLDAVDVLRACFPGGSITGAPKKRAMEIIGMLEPVSRGLYCGSIACLGFNGECRMNIVIRTLIRENHSIHYHVGAGIVADSDPEKEYEETLHKARGLQTALEKWRKIVQKELNNIA
jgi:para-aminobenzoate synthetase component 1